MRDIFLQLLKQLQSFFTPTGGLISPSKINCKSRWDTIPSQKYNKSIPYFVSMIKIKGGEQSRIFITIFSLN